MERMEIKRGSGFTRNQSVSGWCQESITFGNGTTPIHTSYTSSSTSTTPSAPEPPSNIPQPEPAKYEDPPETNTKIEIVTTSVPDGNELRNNARYLCSNVQLGIIVAILLLGFGIVSILIYIKTGNGPGDGTLVSGGLTSSGDNHTESSLTSIPLQITTPNFETSVHNPATNATKIFSSTTIPPPPNPHITILCLHNLTEISNLTTHLTLLSLNEGHPEEWDWDQAPLITGTSITLSISNSSTITPHLKNVLYWLRHAVTNLAIDASAFSCDLNFAPESSIIMPKLTSLEVKNANNCFIRDWVKKLVLPELYKSSICGNHRSSGLEKKWHGDIIDYFKSHSKVFEVLEFQKFC